MKTRYPLTTRRRIRAGSLFQVPEELLKKAQREMAKA